MAKCDKCDKCYWFASPDYGYAPECVYPWFDLGSIDSSNLDAIPLCLDDDVIKPMVV